MLGKNKELIGSYRLVFRLITCLFATACTNNLPEDNYVARVGSTYLTSDHLLKIAPNNATNKELDEEIERWLRRELLLQEALRRKFHEDITLKERIAQTRRDLLIAAIIDTELGQNEIIVEDRDIEQYYEENRDLYIRNEPELRIRHILLSSQRLATALRSSLKGGADFATIAYEHSEDMDTRDNGGKIGFFSRADEPVLWVACIGLELNTISKPIRTDFGYHIIEVLERQQAGTVRTIVEVRKQITESVVLQKQHLRMDKLIETLKKNAEWHIKDNY